MKTNPFTPYTMTEVALPSAQHVANPEQAGSGYVPGATFTTMTSEAIRLRNHRDWLIVRDRYARRQRIKASVAAQAPQQQPHSRPRSHGSMAEAFDFALKKGGAR